MPFEMFTPGKYQARRRQGPAKLVVTQAPNGRTTIILSAAVRDWLGPSPAEPGARYPNNRPTMKVAILVDRDEGLIMLARREDDEEGDGIYGVQGLGGSGSQSYISEWGLNVALGLEPGHYPAQLLGTEMDASEHAVQIDLSERTDSAVRPAKPARSGAEAKTVSPTDQERIDEIRAVIDEGVTLVG